MDLIVTLTSGNKTTSYLTERVDEQGGYCWGLIEANAATFPNSIEASKALLDPHIHSPMFSQLREDGLLVIKTQSPIASAELAFNAEMKQHKADLANLIEAMRATNERYYPNADTSNSFRHWLFTEFGPNVMHKLINFPVKFFTANPEMLYKNKG